MFLKFASIHVHSFKSTPVIILLQKNAKILLRISQCSRSKYSLKKYATLITITFQAEILEKRAGQRASAPRTRDISI